MHPALIPEDKQAIQYHVLMSVRLITDVSIPVWVASKISPVSDHAATPPSPGLFRRVHRRQRPARSRRRKEPQGYPGLHSKFKLQTPHLVPGTQRNRAHPFSSCPLQVFPDQPEKRRASQIFKTAIDSVSCAS
jgi:hypothetical protein